MPIANMPLSQSQRQAPRPGLTDLPLHLGPRMRTLTPLPPPNIITPPPMQKARSGMGMLRAPVESTPLLTLLGYLSTLHSTHSLFNCIASTLATFRLPCASWRFIHGPKEFGITILLITSYEL